MTNGSKNVKREKSPPVRNVRQQQYFHLRKPEGFQLAAVTERLLLFCVICTQALTQINALGPLEAAMM